MPRKLPEDQTMWIAYPDEIEEVTIVEKGTGDRVLKNKLSNPYVIETNSGDRFVMSLNDLYDNPRDAAIEAAKLQAAIGGPEYHGNPIEEGEEEKPDDEDEDDESDVEDDEPSDEDDEDDG